MPAFIATCFVQCNSGLHFIFSMGKTIIGLPLNIVLLVLKRLPRCAILRTLMICLYIVAYIVLKYTGYGRKVYTGSNRKSAWLSGINVRLIEFSVYVIQVSCLLWLELY